MLPTTADPNSTHVPQTVLASLLRLILTAGICWFLGLGVISANYVYHLVHPVCPTAPGAQPPEGFQNIEAASRGGYPIKAWWAPPKNGAAVILLAGYGQSRESLLDQANFLIPKGYGILIPEYRSCAGKIATLGYREVDDLAGAVEYIRLQEAGTRIGVLGFSVGGITAIREAARNEQIRAVIAEGGFAKLTGEITRGNAPPLSITWTIQRWTLFFYSLMTGVLPDQVSPIWDIGSISPRPVFLIYGENEPGSGDGQAQFQAARDPRELWIVPGAGHGEYFQSQPDEYRARVTDFFNHWLLEQP